MITRRDEGSAYTNSPAGYPIYATTTTLSPDQGMQGHVQKGTGEETRIARTDQTPEPAIVSDTAMSNTVASVPPAAITAASTSPSRKNTKTKTRQSPIPSKKVTPKTKSTKSDKKQDTPTPTKKPAPKTKSKKPSTKKSEKKPTPTKKPAPKTKSKKPSTKKSEKKPTPTKKPAPKTKPKKPASKKSDKKQDKPTQDKKPAPKAKPKKLTKKEIAEAKLKSERTLEDELEEQLSEAEIENFQIEKVDMEKLTNKVYNILAERESEGMMQSELWKKLKINARDGSRLTLKLERMGTIIREKLLENKRWIYRLILKKTPISTVSIENAPCLVCPVEAKCSLDGEISPRTCQFIEDWVIADMKRRPSAKSK